MTARANSSLVRFLQTENVNARQKFTFGKHASGIGDELTNVLRASLQTHQSEFATQTAGDEIRSARVTNVV
jgi:hypothetical protein